MRYNEKLDLYLMTQTHLYENFDVVRREVGLGVKKGVLYYLSSLVNEVAITNLLEGIKVAWSASTMEKTLFNGSISKKTNQEEILDDLFSGNAILLLENLKSAMVIDVRSYPTRTISEPTSEQTIRGSRDGFTESINTNVGLIRRRIKDTHLMIETFSVSKKSAISVAVCYLSDQADLGIVEDLKKKIQEINVNSLVMSDRALEEILFKQRFSPFPLVRYTERPDVASINLMNGKILLICDTSASVIITPTTFIDHTKHVEEFRQSPLIGSFTRLLRSIAVLLSFLLLPLWLALVKTDGFHNGLEIEVTLQNNHLLVVQIFVAELIFELLRIASIHTPTQLTSAVGLIAAIVLSQVSLDLGLFLPEIILMCAISAICGFATPSYELSMANKVMKLILILFVAVGGKVGFLIGITLLYIYLSCLKTWDMPYLYPFCPLDTKKALDLFSRSSAKKRKNL